MATSTRTQAIDERVLQAVNAHDVGALEELYSPDAVLMWPGGVSHHGRADIIDHWKHEFEAFPDMRGTVKKRIAQGDTLAVEWTMTGTNTGAERLPDGSIRPPTGKPVNVHGATILTVTDGHIVRDRYYFDQVEILTQLGVVPSE